MPEATHPTVTGAGGTNAPVPTSTTRNLLTSGVASIAAGFTARHIRHTLANGLSAKNVLVAGAETLVAGFAVGAAVESFSKARGWATEGQIFIGR